MPMPSRPEVTAFFHPATYTLTYVVSDPQTKACAIIDPVLDFDAKSGRTATTAADEVAAFVAEQGLNVAWLLETHVHADHLSGQHHLKDKVGGQTAIGARIDTVQGTFAKVFNAEPEFATDGSQFDRLLSDGDELPLGNLAIKVLHTPGHTPACLTYVIGDACFTGDALFMPDFGTARCDFPGGDAATLYDSLQKILALPAETRVFVGHDYAPGGRDYAWETTIAAERAGNIHVKDGTDREAFVKMRSERDATLDMPALILPSVQINMRAGSFPPPEGNGVSYLKLPLNAL